MIREFSLLALRGIIALSLIGWGSAQLPAANVEVRCAPVFVPRCENYLKMFFERGAIPNRCKVS